MAIRLDGRWFVGLQLYNHGYNIHFYNRILEVDSHNVALPAFRVFVSGVLSVLVPPDLVEKHLGGKGKTGCQGVSFRCPYSSMLCDVIPVTASLRKSGQGRAATAFLLSTPQTGVDSIPRHSVCWVGFAVFRPVAALITGVIGGMLVIL